MMKLNPDKILAIIVVIASVLFFVSCSQSSTGIYKTYSFYKINTPGTIPVDENGNEIGKVHDTTYVIYFETRKAAQPKLVGASFNGNFYKMNLFEEKENTIAIGNSLPDNKPVVLKTGSNRKLWKAELGMILKTATEPIKDKSILSIEVEHEGRKAIRVIKKHTELVPELHY